MPTTLNITLADDDADRARAVKDALGLTWEEFIIEAADALDARRERAAVTQDVASSETGDVDAEEIAVPGSGDRERARQEAVLQLYAHLREKGSATRTDFLELIDPDEVGYASADSFWSNVEKAKKYQPLRKLPGVEPPTEGGRTWRYRE